jgi:hypothetical protein
MSSDISQQKGYSNPQRGVRGDPAFARQPYLGEGDMALSKKTLAAFALISALLPAHFTVAQQTPSGGGGQPLVPGGAGPVAPVIPNGQYTVQQASNDRYLDAFYTSSNDYLAVTRPAQRNSTQIWAFTYLGGDTYTIQQTYNGRYLDAYTTEAGKYRVMTREFELDSTQTWKITRVYNGPNMPSTYSLQHVSSGRFLDAYQDDDHDYRAVIWTAQDNTTQRWHIRVPGQ